MLARVDPEKGAEKVANVLGYFFKNSSSIARRVNSKKAILMCNKTNPRRYLWQPRGGDCKSSVSSMAHNLPYKEIVTGKNAPRRHSFSLPGFSLLDFSLLKILFTTLWISAGNSSNRVSKTKLRFAISSNGNQTNRASLAPRPEIRSMRYEISCNQKAGHDGPLHEKNGLSVSNR